VLDKLSHLICMHFISCLVYCETVYVILNTSRI